MCKYEKSVNRVTYSEIRPSALLWLLKESNIVLMLHQHESGMSQVNTAEFVFVHTTQGTTGFHIDCCRLVNRI